ncbi:hypothetical protein TNCV_3414891 [Trichonephila clavipes]|nr:hypothetical protein TNCV_3414891 [Trichonephila clavipes]
MGHEDELTIEFQEILNEEHQETQRNVSPSEQEEEDKREPMSTSAIKNLLKKRRLSDKHTLPTLQKQLSANNYHSQAMALDASE